MNHADGATDAGSDAPADAMSDATKDGAAADAKLDAAADAKDAAQAGSGGSSSTGSGGSGSNGTGSGGSSGMGPGGSTGSPGSGGMFVQGNPACLACEKQKCSGNTDLYGLCLDGTDPYGMKDAKATDGPAAGKLKKDLCQAILTCVRKNQCTDAAGHIQPCYCGTAGGAECLSGMANGPCMKEFEDAAEPTSGQAPYEAVGMNASDPSYALGAAANLVGLCDYWTDNCRSACVADSGMGDGGKSGAGGMAAPGAGGDAGARGGAGGAGGAGGRGGAGGTAGAGAATRTYNLCRACEQRNCPGSGCDFATGTAAAGPAMGQSRKDLCLAVVACQRATKCDVKGNAQTCYCQPNKSGLCVAGPPTGACRAQIEAAAESTVVDDIQSRFTNVDPSTPMPYALGFATDLIGCDHFDDFGCSDVCTNGDPPGGANGGTSGAAGAGGSGTAGATGTAGASGTAGTVGTAGATGLAGAGGAAAAGGAVGSGGVTGSGGVSGSGGTPGGCADLNANGVPDCTETLAMNSTFASSLASWPTEYAMTAAWVAGPAGDAAASAGSGGLNVTNPVVADLEGITMGGASQCLAVSKATYAVYAQVFIPTGQGQGGAGIAVNYYPSGDCTGAASASFTTGFATAGGSWSTVQGGSAAPSGTGSISVRLVIQKPFRAGAFQAIFDNVLLK